jgi:peptide/nickel transport system substrate-binding protein
MRKLLVIFLLVFVLGFSFSAYASGILKIGIPSSYNTLDPSKQKLGEEYVASFLIFNGLTVIDQNRNAQPDLAERWESSDDLKTWTFYLRKGVKFHHGRELDAEDVAKTFTRIMAKETGSVGRVYLQIVDKIEVVDKYTIRLKLNIPYVEVPEILGERQMKIVPRDRVDTLSSEPIGTGPFKFKSYMHADRVELIKNPNFFEKGLPLLDGVTLRIIPEAAARVTALERGEIDILWSLPLESFERIKNNPRIVVEETPTSSWDGITIHNEIAPFDKLKVRQAINLAIDKDQMVKLAIFGHGMPTHSPIPPRHAFFNKNIPFKTDLTEAKKLMAEAGYPNGFEVTMFVPVGRETRVRLGIAAREMLKPLGINVNIQRVTVDKFVADIEGKAPFYSNGFWGRPTMDTSLYPWFHSQGSWNRLGWYFNNPKVDKLLDLGRQTKSFEERKKIYMEFQKEIVENPPGVIAYVINHVNAYRKEVQGLDKGFNPNPLMVFDLKRVILSK